MTTLSTQQNSAGELTDDGSFDGDLLSARRHDLRILPQRSHRVSHLTRSKQLLKKIPWQQALVMGGIIVVAFISSAFLNLTIAAGVIRHTQIVRFLENNLSMLIVSFGFAIYGCFVNRKLLRENQKRQNLGPYKLLKLIGSGGMGEVYLAEHELLRRRCAVKLIRADKSSNRRMLARFEREVKATAQLTHWNTVQVFDYGCTADGTFYYAMEYLQGLNLRQLVDQHGAIPPGRTIFILRQLCGALHEAAMFGLVHRDIKPSNIFLTERGQMYDVAKLLDFGLVRPASFGTCPIRNVSRQLQGSPRFMCPEQAQGQKPDCRGDLYSLACVAYFLLAGRAPFEDENPILLVVAHASVRPQTFEEIGVSVPNDLAEIVMRCLRKNPEERYQSPRELLAALNKCESANDWTWDDAEDWWAFHPEETHHQPGEQGTSTEPSPTDSAALSEPDATFVCADRGRNDSMF